MRALFLLTAVTSASAPVPPCRKPPPPASPVGVWVMTYGDFKYRPVAFCKDGHYEWANGQGTKWVGRWKADGNRLTVTERPDQFGAPEVTWTAAMDLGWATGRLSDGRFFQLEKFDGRTPLPGRSDLP